MNQKSTKELAKPLFDLIKHRQVQNGGCCFVALDGRSGSGKSTLAAHVASQIPSVTVIEGDDFYTGGSFKVWSSRPVSENAHSCVNWKHQHTVISSLRSKGVASWHAFDWHSESWDSEQVPYCATKSTCTATEIVLLEGVYSARTELSSLFDLRVVLEVPEQVRRKQLIDREGNNLRTDWEQVWSDAEHFYFKNRLDHQTLSLVLV